MKPSSTLKQRFDDACEWAHYSEGLLAILAGVFVAGYLRLGILWFIHH